MKIETVGANQLINYSEDQDGRGSSHHQIQRYAFPPTQWQTGGRLQRRRNYNRPAHKRSESHATTHSKHLTASTMCLRCNLHAQCPPGIPSSMRQRHQPVERRTLRSHGTRGGGSDLVKVCNEVVQVAGMNVTIFTDSRRKCIGGSQTCPAPAAQISTSAQPLWSCRIST